MPSDCPNSGTDAYVLVAQKLNRILTVRYVQFAHSLLEALSSRLRHTMQRYEDLAKSADFARIACRILLWTTSWNDDDQDDYEELMFVRYSLERVLL